jgi:putative transposase
MARLRRIVVPGQPLHIVQRGNNRQPTFFANKDYQRYLDDLSEAGRRCRWADEVAMADGGVSPGRS